MGLPILTVLEGDAAYEQGYHNEESRLLPSSKTLMEETQEMLPRKKKRKIRQGGRLRASDRAVVNGIWYVLWAGCQWKTVHRDWFGVSSSVIHERFQRWRQMGVFEKLMRRMAEYYR